MQHKIPPFEVTGADIETAAQLVAFWLDPRPIEAQRGPGSVLLGPMDVSRKLKSGAAVLAPPGIMLRTPAGAAEDYSSTGWRIACWDADEQGHVARIDERRPNTHRRVSFAEARAWYRSTCKEPDLLETWAQTAMRQCITTWYTLIRPASTASARVIEDSLNQLEQALEDCERAWGKGWVKQHGGGDVYRRMRKRRTEHRQLPNVEGAEQGSRAQPRNPRAEASLSA